MTGRWAASGHGDPDVGELLGTWWGPVGGMPGGEVCSWGLRIHALPAVTGSDWLLNCFMFLLCSRIWDTASGQCLKTLIGEAAGLGSRPGCLLVSRVGASTLAPLPTFAFLWFPGARLLSPGSAPVPTGSFPAPGPLQDPGATLMPVPVRPLHAPSQPWGFPEVGEPSGGLRSPPQASECHGHEEGGRPRASRRWVGPDTIPRCQSLP